MAVVSVSPVLEASHGLHEAGWLRGAPPGGAGAEPGPVKAVGFLRPWCFYCMDLLQTCHEQRRVL